MSLRANHSQAHSDLSLHRLRDRSIIASLKQHQRSRNIIVRTKLAASLLSFVSAFLLSGYAYLSVQTGRPLRCTEFARFSEVILWNSVLHFDESGGSRSLRLAEAALVAPTSYEVAVAGRNRSLLLPAYSVRRPEGDYLTFSDFDELQTYFHKTLPRAGWKHVDQMGAGHFFVGDDAGMTITHRFYLGTGISEFNISLHERSR